VCLKASAVKSMRTVFFWVIMQEVVVISYQCFGTMCFGLVAF